MRYELSMSKKFRCGRLLLSRDGRVKKLDLGNGGGTRTCDWPDDRMTFDDVHKQLLTVFASTDKKQQTALYDFQHQPLNIKQFPTFADYINKYGLNRNSTVVYLCTSEKDIDIPTRVETEKITVIPLPVVKKEPDSKAEENEPSPSKPSSSEYSFIHASNELMKNIRELINQNPTNQALIQLFENICLIHGYVFSIILPLQQHKHNDGSNESEVTLYVNNLNNVYDIFETTKSLLRRHADHCRHLRLYTTIRSSFFQFHNNVKIVRNRWAKNVDNNNSTFDTTLSSLAMSDSQPRLRQGRPGESPSPSASARRAKSSYLIFKSLSNHFHCLLRSSKTGQVPAFRSVVVQTVEKLKRLQTTLDLSNVISMYEGKTVLLRIKSQMSKQFSDLEAEPRKSPTHRSLLGFRPTTMKAIRSTLTSIYRYRMLVSEEQQSNTSKS